MKRRLQAEQAERERLAAIQRQVEAQRADRERAARVERERLAAIARQREAERDERIERERVEREARKALEIRPLVSLPPMPLLLDDEMRRANENAMIMDMTRRRIAYDTAAREAAFRGEYPPLGWNPYHGPWPR